MRPMLPHLMCNLVGHMHSLVACIACPAEGARMLLPESMELTDLFQLPFGIGGLRACTHFERNWSERTQFLRAARPGWSGRRQAVRVADEHVTV